MLTERPTRNMGHAYHEAGHFTAAHVLCDQDSCLCCVLGIFLDSPSPSVSLRFHPPTRFEPVAVILLAGIVAQSIYDELRGVGSRVAPEVRVEKIAHTHMYRGGMSDIQRVAVLAGHVSADGSGTNEVGEREIPSDILNGVLQTEYNDPPAHVVPPVIWDEFFPKTLSLLQKHWRQTATVAAALMEKGRLFPYEAEEAFRGR